MTAVALTARIVPVVVLALSVASASPVVMESQEIRTPLLELYTSEGCSSCPPADAWFGSLKEDPGLWRDFVPVGFHVDYWNSLGWSDPFSLASFSERQRAYGAAWGAPTIYTPEFVLNGAEWRRGGGRLAGDGRRVGVLRAVVEAGTLSVRFTPVGKLTGPLLVEVAPLTSATSRKIPRGENAGRTLLHEFVARDLIASDLVAQPDGTFTAQLRLPGEVPKAVAVWVRTPESPAPLQAVGGWLQASQ